MITKTSDEIKEYVKRRLENDPRLNYRIQVLSALEEHLGDAEKDGDCARVEMYHAAIIAIGRMPV